ncbi:PH domain-containing protein [Staphylococcus epidermidis]|uniref:PH domain-containing protein n=1 Tax=Staphylococcus epidermidis TaxID=1282 RepID=UPI000C16D653|nr:PH domain-containing protein [Staphylococcus epidermidis]ATQ49374.1 hypothetical protein CPZ17_02395 [Staphylococcus epidermidis]MBE7303736.1 hypothetical protein [Staphylococcus epidermidis]MCG1098982.1 hypothetical protein [Staphylococcus epidermidis]MCG1162312.1 hypothetical protein [Staphylococcus epidermidis]MCG1299485.1 hypothetical protein [Staphylococcus epidermidis]
MTQEVYCNYKPHIPRIMTVPGILLISENKLEFQAYNQNNNPFNIQFELSSIVRYRISKGLLGNKLFIYYSDREWYKFSNLSKNDLNKLTKYLY